MKIAHAHQNFLLIDDDGRIHYPFSKFLSEKFDNPNTRELVAQSLRIFYRFCNAHQIELAVRAVEGRCLTSQEASMLAGLCYRPLPEIELLSDKKITLITSAKSQKAPRSLPKAVEPNSVKKRLNHISSFLDYYFVNFLDPHIRSSALRAELRDRYVRIREQLGDEVAGTKQNHHLMIQSLPGERFKQVIRALVVESEGLFRTEMDEISTTLYRDRAMSLLACEGVRPGAIGNIAREDFREDGGYLRIKDHRARRQGRPNSGDPVLKLGRSSSVNSASETLIKLYPWTVDAVIDYIEKERGAVLAKHLQNRSRGFLFLNQSGEPIGHRSTLTNMFNKLGRGLRAMGLLAVGNDQHFHNKKEYEFYGYVLRHSAASFYMAAKGTSETVKDEMRIRFGWTLKSKMPDHYAARAISDQANVNMIEFYQSLQDGKITYSGRS
jgi:integrase